MKTLSEVNEGMKAWVGLKIVEVGTVNDVPVIKLSNGAMIEIGNQLV